MSTKKRKYHVLMALKGKMRSEGQTTITMAEFLGIAPNTFSLKINGISEFSCSEIGQICKVLGIKPKDMVEYFFPLMFQKETRAS